ncbi:hypothetical protein HBH61_253130, partial [Parastagonospora nodorum]
LFYSKALAINCNNSSKSLLFLALACLKNLEVLVILSSKELLALVILQSKRNSAESLIANLFLVASSNYKGRDRALSII